MRMNVRQKEKQRLNERKNEKVSFTLTQQRTVIIKKKERVNKTDRQIFIEEREKKR